MVWGAWICLLSPLVAACLITLENLDSPGIRITPVDLLTTVRSLADQACLVP